MVDHDWMVKTLGCDQKGKGFKPHFGHVVVMASSYDFVMGQQSTEIVKIKIKMCPCNHMFIVIMY
jgi:hypothetical protein